MSEDVRNINKVAPVTKSAPGAAGAVRKDKAWVLKGKPVEVSFFRISDCHQDKDALHSLDLIISLLRIFFCLWQVKWDGDWWQAKIKMVKYAPNSDKPDKVCYPYRFPASVCPIIMFLLLCFALCNKIPVAWFFQPFTK